MSEKVFTDEGMGIVYYPSTSFAVPIILIYSHKLDPFAKLLYVTLLCHAGGSNTVKLTGKTLAQSTGISASALKKAREALIECDLIKVTGGGKGKPSTYELLDIKDSSIAENKSEEEIDPASTN